MHGEPYSTETLSRLIAPGRMNGNQVKFARLPVSWPEPEPQPATLIPRQVMKTNRLPDSFGLQLTQLSESALWEAWSYGILWLGALWSLWCCFR